MCLLRGESPASVVLFLDLWPVPTGHLLVVPRRHYVELDDLPPDVHLHVIPRFAGDGFRLAADWRVHALPDTS